MCGALCQVLSGSRSEGGQGEGLPAAAHSSRGEAREGWPAEVCRGCWFQWGTKTPRLLLPELVFRHESSLLGAGRGGGGGAGGGQL